METAGIGGAAGYAISTLSVEVVDYALIDDANYYNHHLFMLQVWIEQDMVKINRSYAAFMELDARLRRTFPRSDLPTLPLAAASSSSGKSGGKRFSILGGNSSNTTAPSERDSMLHRPADIRSSIIEVNAADKNNTDKAGKKKLMKRIDTKEVIAQKKQALTYYLTDLLRVPEVLMSDVLLYFLDEESSDGDISEDLPEDFMEIYELHMLLQDEPHRSKTVRKEYKLPLELEAGQVVLWSFYTKLHDIGFCVHQDDKEVTAYQRYNSHEKHVIGCLEIRNESKIELVWDNSYSKFRSKQLEYVVKVCPQETYELMKMTAQEVKTMKRSAILYRAKLKRSLQKLSNDLIAELHPNKARESNEDLTTTESDASNNKNRLAASSEMDSKYFLEQLTKLQNEKKSLQLAYSECEIALVAERSACAKVQQQLDDIQLSKDLMEEEFIEVKGELESVRNDYYDLVHHTSSNNTSGNASAMSHATAADSAYKYAMEDLMIMNDITTLQSPEVAVANFQALMTFAKTLQAKTNDLEETLKQQESVLNKWKVEKKQLKTVAIQFKEKSELLEHDKAMIVAQCEDFHQQWKNAEAKVKQLEAENEELKKVNSRQEIVIAAAKMKEVAMEEEAAAASTVNVAALKISSADNNDGTATAESSSSQHSFSFMPLSRGSSFVSMGESSPVRSSMAHNSDNGTSSPMMSSSFSSSSMLKKLFEAASTTSTTSATPPTSTSPTPMRVTSDELQDAQLQVQIPKTTSEDWNNEGSSNHGIAFENEETSSYVGSPDQYKKLIVHDFSKVEQDEISHYLTKATSSLMDMMPTWDAILGINEESTSQHGSSHSSNSNSAQQPTELTTFSIKSGLTADGSPVPDPVEAAVADNKVAKSRNGSVTGAAAGNNNNASYIPTPFTTSTFRNMTFGF